VPAGGALAPLIQRMSKLLKGSVQGILDRMKTDAVGDFKPIRASLPQQPLSYLTRCETGVVPGGSLGNANETTQGGIE
jgi:hypothetical protein